MRNTRYALVCALFAACAWGEGSGEEPQDPQPDPAPISCGDGTCSPTEVGTCASDCGSSNGNNAVCGNGTCEGIESPANCAVDCSASGPVCGDGTCDAAGGETSSNCAGDCTSGGGGGNLDCNDFATLFACAACLDDPSTCSSLGVDEAGCNACLGGGGGAGCGDGTCDAAAGEDVNTCPFDCM